MRVLVTDGDYKHSLAIVRALGQFGIRPYVTTHTLKCLAGASRYCAGEIKVPRYSDALFGPMFLDRIREYHIDLVIPVGTDAFRNLVPLKEQISRIAQMVSVDEEKLKLCFSKIETYKLARSLKVPVPQTIAPQSLEELQNIVQTDQVTYPCVIKGNQEMGVNAVEYAMNAEELVVKYQALCRRFGFSKPFELPILQEFIEGYGCGFFAIYDHGSCGPTFQHRRLREFPPSGGYSVAARAYRDSRLLNYGKRLLDHLKWHGVAMVEFKMSTHGPVLMEINPKFWGTLDLALESGVNFPIEIVRMAQGGNLSFSQDYNDEQHYHWPLHGEFEHLACRPASAAAVFHDCIHPKMHSNLWLFRDPFPIPKMAGHALLSLGGLAARAIKSKIINL